MVECLFTWVLEGAYDQSKGQAFVVVRDPYVPAVEETQAQEEG